MKQHKFFVMRNGFICHRYCYQYAAERYFLKRKDRHSRSHFRVEDLKGNVIMSNRLITAA